MTHRCFHAVNNRVDDGRPKHHVPHGVYEDNFSSMGTFIIPRANICTVFSGTSSAGCAASAFSALGFRGVNPRSAIVHAVKGVAA